MIIEVYGAWGGGGVFALHWVLKETQAFENTESQSDLRYTLGESLGVGVGRREANVHSYYPCPKPMISLATVLQIHK